MNKPTHIMKCMEILSMTDKWLHAYDFNSYGGVFIGHRGCARISDCQKKYPYLVAVNTDPLKPRLYIYRLRWENLDSAMDKLRVEDPEAYVFLKDVLRRKAVTWKEYRMVPVETPQHTIVMERRLIDVK